jgi:tetratricopeptide (TPR) repeat protein
MGEKRPEKFIMADDFLDKGVAQYNQFHYEQAGVFFMKALYSYRSIDDPKGIVTACINLSKTSLSLGDTDKAEKFIKSAKKVIFHSPEIIQLRSYLSIVESSINIKKKEYRLAKILLQPILEQELNNRNINIAAVQNRTIIAFKEDDNASYWVDQYAHLIKIIDGELSPRKSKQKARLLRFKAQLSHQLLEQTEYYQKALQLYRRTAHQTGIAATLEEWARKEYLMSEYSLAEDKLIRALYIRITLKDKQKIIEIVSLLKSIYKNMNKRKKK